MRFWSSLLDTRRLAFWFLRRTFWADRRVSVGSQPHLEQYTFVVMTMVRNAEHYLCNWVLFHHQAGAEHFFVYVNENQVAAVHRLRSSLREENLDSLVTFIFWPEPSFLVRRGSSPNGRRLLPTTHEAACMHFRRTFGRVSDYYMKLDLDEFFFRTDFVEHGLDIRPLLDFEGNLWVFGFNFGSSGHLKFSPVPDPCRFRYRQAERQWQKSISHTNTTREVFNTHMAQAAPGVRSPGARPLQINHYRIRSLDEFHAHKLVRDGTLGRDYDEGDFELLDLDYNVVQDDAACIAYWMAETLWRQRAYSGEEDR